MIRINAKRREFIGVGPLWLKFTRRSGLILEEGIRHDEGFGARCNGATAKADAPCAHGAGAGLVAAGGAALALRGSGYGLRLHFDDRTLRRGNNSEPDTLDPALAWTSYEDMIIGDIFLG
jgi:hypothetical protein